MTTRTNRKTVERRAPTSPLRSSAETTQASPSVAPPKPPYGGEAYLPTDAAERKTIPVCTGFLDYFPLAILEVAKVSFAGNQQHNPGEPLHWARGKSMDQADTAVRHIMERGGIDIDGRRHTAKAIWRLMADLQIEMEAELGKPISRGSSAT